jgi:hypothetical protein
LKANKEYTNIVQTFDINWLIRENNIERRNQIMKIFTNTFRTKAFLQAVVDFQSGTTALKS